MRESPQRSSVEIVKALVLLSCLRFRHTLGWPGRVLAGMKTPTQGRNAKGVWLVVLFGGLFFVQAFWMSHRMVVNYAERSMGEREGVILVDDYLYSVIQRSAGPDPDLEEFRRSVGGPLMIDKMERERRGIAPVTEEEVIARFWEEGLAGFVNYERFTKSGASLDHLQEGGRQRFERLVGMVLLASLSALLFMPLAMRERDLAATNDHLEWLFSLPLKGSELLLGKFVSITLIRPLIYLILWPILTNLLIADGRGIAISAATALGVAFLVSVALSGLEILVDTWLRSRGSARLVKNVQMVFSITGLLSFYGVLAACIASGPSFAWVNWLAVRFPGALGQPLGALVLSPAVVLWGVVIVVAMIFGLGGFMVADRLTRGGLLSGNVQQAKVRGIVGQDLRKSGLLRFEWLLLLRDRALATQVIMVPMLLAIYQLLVNPTMISGATVGGICAMAYGCGTYASLITAPQLLMSEAKGVWLIYNLPVPIAAYFSRREVVWRSVATGLAGIVVVAMILYSGDFQVGELWRYFAALAGVWVMGRVVSGVVMGKPEMPDVASGERPKMSFGRMYGAMILAGMYGALLWHGLVWPMVSALVIFWFLGIAIWQRREISFSYLMEPTEKEPPSWGVDDGLWSVFVFFAVQIISALMLGIGGELNGGGLLISFVVGGLVALLFAWNRKRSKGAHLPWSEAESGISKGRAVSETGIATVICLAVGALWMMVLKMGYFVDPSELEGGLMSVDQPVFWLLAVVAAPLIEEPLFRGFVCRTMMAFWSRTQAIVASALLFAIVHPGTSFPPVFVLGLATAILYTRTRSLIPGIVLHDLYNLGVLMLASA